MASTIEELWPDGVTDDGSPFPPAVKAGEWVFLSGQFVRDPDLGLNPNFPFYGNEEELQTEYIFDQIEKIVSEAGGTLDDMMRIYQWREAPEEDREWLDGKAWTRLNITRYIDIKGEKNLDAGSSHMGVLGLPTEQIAGVPSEDVVVMVDGIFRTGDEEKIAVRNVPELGEQRSAYARMLEKGGFLFTAGEVPTDFTGDWGTSEHRLDQWPDPRAPEHVATAPEARSNPYMWYGEPVKAHTNYTLEMIDTIAEHVGTPLENTVKAEVYLGDPSDFNQMEEAWREWFPEDPPARIVVPHQGVGIKGCLVEMALQLVKPDAGIGVETIETDEAPSPVTHQPQAVRAGDLLFVSGHMAHDEQGLCKPSQTPKRQMDQIFENISAICEAAGTSLDHAARCQGFYTSSKAYVGAMKSWRERFEPGNRPAHTPIIVGDPLFVPGCDILVEMVVYAP